MHLQDSDYSWLEGDAHPFANASAKEKLQIAFVCIPHSGHMIPMLNIADFVMSQGRHHVRLHTADFAAQGFEKKVKQIKAELVPVDTKGMTDESLEEQSKIRDVLPYNILTEVMYDSLVRSFQESRPDVVVADFATVAAMDAAKALGIPLVINVPGPVSMLRDFLGLMDPSTHTSRFGFHFGRTTFSPFVLLRCVNLKGFGSWATSLREHVLDGALMLVQTIWGLDKPQPLPPNIVVTGPVLPPPLDLRERLAAEHKELYRFLHASGLEGVVYVSTGSMAKLTQWQVEVVYNGLKKAGYRVVWSLKDDQQKFLPSRDDPQFFISSWLPQAELLQDPAVKAVITHCGWGGVLETLTAAKPVVTFPFFGDQPSNAKLLVSAGCGEFMGKLPPEGDIGNRYKKGDFTVETVSSAVTKVMTDPRYAQAAVRLQSASRACGGAEAAAQQIEWTARFGTMHLRSAELRGSMGTNPLWGYMFTAVGLAGLAGLVAYQRRALRA